MELDDMMVYALRFPIGDFKAHDTFTDLLKKQYIGNIADLPYLISLNVNDLSEKELQYLYRPQGWSINEVVHHLVDSHMNAFIRFKLALTEDGPNIKPYDEAKCVKLGDCTLASLEDSKMLLTYLHKKWVTLLESMSDEDYQKSYFHPASGKEYKLHVVLALYSWHSLHHLAHIKQALDKKY